jgi:UPF0755 protein
MSFSNLLRSALRSVFWTIVVLGLVSALVAWALWNRYQQFLATPLELDSEEIIIDVPRGTTMRALGQRLREDRIFDNPYWFLALAYQRGQLNALKAGEYAVTSGTLPEELLDQLVTGRSIELPITFIEGWTYRDAIQAIAKRSSFVSELSDLSDEAIAERLQIPQGHPEGWFFPDTYRFPRGSTDVTILTRAYERMRAVLDQEWGDRAPDLPVTTPYEALILASIIEKETGVASERPAISGVFTRRLREGMRLQTDPTVIYGMGEDYDGNIRKSDLTTPTPYNTYVIDGLPPTPIALPGRAAIHAAVHPEDGEALYFVARGDGSHHFSATLEQHNCAVRHYQLGRPCGQLEPQPPAQ